jgi:hypothetical protein
MMTRRAGAAVALALAILPAAGCTNFGASQVPVAQFDYNRAVASAMQEQMLLNVVRIRYFEAPVFLAVSSILTQYVWQGTAGVSAQRGIDVPGGVAAPSSVGGSAVAVYAERPTVTFLPVEGDDFSKRIFSPLPLEFIFALQEAGYATDLLFRSGIARMNEVQNMSVSPVSAPDDVDAQRQARREVEKLQRYQHLVDIMLRLYHLDMTEMQTRIDGDGRERFLVFSPARTAEQAALVAEFKTLLGLDPEKNEFRVTGRRLGRAPDEITIQTRSLSQIMGFLAQGVDIPEAQRDQVMMLDEASMAEAVSLGRGIPFRVRATETRPADAFVAVEYGGWWYSIANNDIESKRAFNLLISGFRLLSPERTAVAPALTLPTGP